MTEVDRVVSRARRGRALFVSAIAALCLVVIGAVAFAIAVNVDQGSQITKVERFSCAKAPASIECQQTKRRSDRQRSIADTCIAFWKVGYACPKPSSGVTIGSLDEPGGASQPAPTAGQKPDSGETGGTRHPIKRNPPAAEDNPAAVNESGPSSPAAETSPATSTDAESGKGPPADTPAAEAPGLVGGLTKGLADAIDDVGNGVDQTLCPVERSALCPD